MSRPMNIPRMIRKARRLVLIIDFHWTTWMLLGAAFQLLALCILPLWLGMLPTAGLLAQRLITTVSKTRQLATTPFPDVLAGRWTTRVPSSESSAESAAPAGVVMFVLGARINHPLGRLAAGAPEMNSMFMDMWREAELNRSKWGFLGRTETHVSAQDEKGITFLWLSYWKDLDKLREFATGDTHRVGQNAYIKKRFPHIGIMHETYQAPAGSWETIYLNYPPFGMGSTYTVSESDSKKNEIVGSLIPAAGSQMQSMYGRMGRRD